MRPAAPRTRHRLASSWAVAIASAALTLGCTTAVSGGPHGSPGAPLPGSGTRASGWGAAAIVYGRGTDELVYDSELRVVRMPTGALDLPGTGDVSTDLAKGLVPVDAVSCSPDGSRVLVLSQRSKAHWWLVDLDGSGRREIALGRRGSQVLKVGWEPDGKSVLVLRQADALPARTSLTRELLDTPPPGVARSQTLIPLSAGRYVSTMSVSPDGRRLLVGVWEQVGPGPQLKSSLWLVPVSDPAAAPPSAGTWREVATDRTLSFSAAEWSPDGRWVAFRGGQMTSGDRGSTPMAGHLYLMHPDGSQLHRVPGAANRNTSAYQWFPDGHTLAFLTGTYRSESDFDWPDRLALLDVDGGRGPVLTDHRNLDGYILSPDGRAMLALVGDNLVVQPVASDGRTQVVDSAGYFGGWSWCAQGESP